jgi:hypothetical protein
MDPAIAGAAAGGAIQIIGSVVGELLAAGDRKRAAALMEQAASQYNIDLPELQKLVAEQLGPSAYESIKTDPMLREAQMGSLDTLEQMNQAGGYTLEDQSVLNKTLNKVARNNASANAQVRNDMAARGVGGSGAELAMQLSNNQAGAQRAAETGLDVAAGAQRRRFDSILSKGRMAGDVRNQDFSEASRKADAQDSIDRWNASARTDANRYNSGLSQQNFNNRMRLADSRAGVNRTQAGYYSDQSDRKAGMAGGTGKGVGEMTYAGGSYLARQEEEERRRREGGGY